MPIIIISNEYARKLTLIQIEVSLLVHYIIYRFSCYGGVANHDTTRLPLSKNSATQGPDQNGGFRGLKPPSFPIGVVQ